MTPKTYIKRDIINFVEDHSFLFTNYGNWYIGITSNPEYYGYNYGTKTIHHSWEATSPEDALGVAMYFLSEGMKSGPGYGTFPCFVYIYKKNRFGLGRG